VENNQNNVGGRRMSEGKKKCSSCGKMLSVSEYYRAGKYYMPECKGCNKARAKAWRIKNPRRFKEIKDRWRRQNREKVVGYVAGYRKGNPIKAWAQRVFYVALRAGRIKKHPCAVCGKTRAEGHHLNYRHPLHVLWVCVLHHKMIHHFPEGLPDLGRWYVSTGRPGVFC